MTLHVARGGVGEQRTKRIAVTDGDVGRGVSPQTVVNGALRQEPIIAQDKSLVKRLLVGRDAGQATVEGQSESRGEVPLDVSRGRQKEVSASGGVAGEVVGVAIGEEGERQSDGRLEIVVAICQLGRDVQAEATRRHVVAEAAERVGEAGQLTAQAPPGTDEARAQGEGDGVEIERERRMRVGVENGRLDALLLLVAVAPADGEAVRMGAVDVERAERVGATAVATDQLQFVGEGTAGERGYLMVGVGATDRLARVVPPEVDLQLVANV